MSAEITFDYMPSVPLRRELDIVRALSRLYGRYHSYRSMNTINGIIGYFVFDRRETILPSLGPWSAEVERVNGKWKI